jgi:23S rRNA pseudouridine1911/1915/1917 synthase
MERVIELRVDRDGPRVDKYIAEKLSELSRSFVRKLLDEGRITIAGQPPKASYKVEAGDVVIVRVPPPRETQVQAEPIPLDILYEDDDIIVVDKAAGMVVHPAYGHPSGTLVNALLAHGVGLSGIGGELRPGIVHRLDKDTSGLLVVAKNDSAHRHLQEQFEQRQVHKTYLALTEGQLPAASGVIEAPIGRDPQRRKLMAVLSRGGREARTMYRVVQSFAEHTLVEANPITGRTHQIRVHFKSIGHPIAGDPVYGYRKQRLPLRRQFLHAARMAFSSPGTGQPVEFSSPLPDDLAAVLEQLRKST